MHSHADPAILTIDLWNEWRWRGCQVTTYQIWWKYCQPFCV